MKATTAQGAAGWIPARSVNQHSLRGHVFTKTTFDLGQGQTLTFESPDASLGRRAWECDCCGLVILTLPKDSAAAYACPQCAAAGCADGGEFSETPTVPYLTAETMALKPGEAE